MRTNGIRLLLLLAAILLCSVRSALADLPSPSVKPNGTPGNGDYDHNNLLPFGPTTLGTMTDMQIWAPPDLYPIDGFIKPNTGPYFQYQRLFWSIHQPAHALVGSPDPLAAGLSDNDNSFIHATFVWGNIFDFGFMDDCGYGWNCSILKTNDQFNSLHESQTNVGFINGPTGTATQITFNAPVITGDLQLLNVTRMAGIDLMKTWRYPQSEKNGGFFDMGAGVRFFQFHDRFDVSEPNALAPIADWDLGIDNDIVGPEVAIRYVQQREHWIFDGQFKFTAGANFQNATETGSTINQNLQGFPNIGFINHLNVVTFAPLGELRLNESYQLTKNASITVGYSGILMSGIGRASRRIDYTLNNVTGLGSTAGQDLGIINGAKNDHVFINGVNFGFQINR
jgi:hypothetical protein